MQITVTLLSLVILSRVQSVFAQTNTCITFANKVLSYGAKDSASDSSILKMQRYLVTKGYLMATPNGYFGSATRQAVKKFQVANGISNTGQLGPLTKALIQRQSCQATVSTSVPLASQNNPSPSLVPIPSPTLASVTNLVTSPAASSTLITDSKNDITWTSQSGDTYDILIEDQYGVGAGYIASNVTGGIRSWNTGHVYTGNNSSDQLLPPGIYRIHLRPSNINPSIPDKYSGLFTVVGRPIILNFVTPATISNKHDTAISINGSGFDSTTQIIFDSPIYGSVSRPSFVSADGTVIVYNVALGMYPVTHTISVYNTYASGATSSPSNSLNLTVTN